MQDINKEDLEGSIIKIDEKLMTNHLNEIVLEIVEQTLNGLLEAEANQIVIFTQIENPVRYKKAVFLIVKLCNTLVYN